MTGDFSSPLYFITKINLKNGVCSIRPSDFCIIDASDHKGTHNLQYLQVSERKEP